MSAVDILELPIAPGIDLVRVRSRVRRLAELLGYESQDQTRVATAISEVAREIAHRGGTADVAFMLAGSSLERRLVVTCVVDLPEAPTTPDALGDGLVHARRLMDGFEFAVDGARASLTLWKRAPRNKTSPTLKQLAAIRKAMQTTMAEDSVEDIEAHNRELIRGLDAVKEKSEQLERLNVELETTNRGVVALYAELDQKSIELRQLNRTLEDRVAQAISDRERTFEQLRQSQKMEAVGQLTGGIAHDFNNLLQAITGNLDIINRNLPADSPRLERAISQATRAANSAASLTRRLLAFSRQQALAPIPLNVNDLVESMRDLLQRTLGETIRVKTRFAKSPWTIEVDPNELENAILNLCVNSRDAMPEGGTLTIETENVDETEGPDLEPGAYVAIRVIDTGTGMTREALARAFEPFFTTKEVGKGTGLGLAMVYGFAKQSGGASRVASTLGVGTTITLMFPRFHGTEVVDAQVARQKAEHGTETILVVEDDEAVRAYAEDALTELGYRVLLAHDGPSALLHIASGPHIDVLFTDVVLAGGMTGPQLAVMAKATRPELRVLFATGYARKALEHHGRLDADVDVLTKPYEFTELAGTLRAVLAKK